MQQAPTTAATHPNNTRAAVLIACAVVFLATTFFLTTTAFASEAAVLLSDGVVVLIWTALACALGTVLLRWISVKCDPCLLIATAAGLGLGIFGLLGLGLGLLGWLNQATTLALPIGSAILFIWGMRGRNFSLPLDWLRQPAGLNWLWIVVAVSLGMAAVAGSVMPGVFWKPIDPHPYDVVSYHLQVPREWYEAGRIVPLHHNVFSFFPFNVEMQFLLLMHLMRGPWNAMYACQLMQTIYTALMLLAVASEGGVIAAAVAASVPWVIMLGGVAYVESALLLYTALALVWRKNLLIAGAMAGFACGVKITAVPMLLIAIPIAIVAVTRKIKVCVMFVIVGGIVLSPWPIRNVVWAKNPVFPLAMKTLGQAHFSDDQVKRFEIAHRPRPEQRPAIARLRIFWNDVAANWQYGYLLLPLGLIAMSLRWRDRETWMLAIVGAIIFMVWIGFTHLQPRFFVMIVPVAAILAGRMKWGKALPAVVALILIAAGMSWANVGGQIAVITRDPVRGAFIGVRDLSFIVPPELAEISSPDTQVGLVGDAGAFFYQMPMSRLHYRTVFDVPADAADPIDAWVGPAAKGNANWLLVINPAEIERLHATYWKIAALPMGWAGRGEPFVLRGNEAGH